MQPDNNPYTMNSDQPYNVQGAKKPDRRKNSNLKEHLSTLLIIIAAPLLAILISLFVFRTYQVDGPSMETTLQNNDRLIINKLPVTISSITGRDYIPARYDIVVFNQKGSFNGSSSVNKQLIKRVIGLPGDRIVIKDGDVRIFNDENPDGFLVDRQGPHAATIKATTGNHNETIQDNEIFVIGDNRKNSLDSRNFGTIESSQIVGKLSFRVYPLSNWETY